MTDPGRGDETGSALLVLIAEDEEPIAEVLAMIIEDCGYSTLVAVHGKQALEMASARRPALIITDLMMPQMSGAELVSAVRADAVAHGYAPPPILLMSAAGSRYTEPVGADAVLPKPFDIRQVESLLNRFLGPAARQP